MVNSGSRLGTQARTQERILAGASRAIARHGLAKLGMRDVSESAGVSRGTLYRYFPTRDDLLTGLVQEEVRRFRERVSAALEDSSGGEERIRVVLEQAMQHIREHAALQRMLETDPAFLLRSLRAQFTTIRSGLHELLGPLLRDTQPVRNGVVSESHLVDWMTRMLISVLLFQDPDPDEMARAMTAMYRMLTDRSEPQPAQAKPRKRRPSGGGRRAR